LAGDAKAEPELGGAGIFAEVGESPAQMV